MLNVTVEDLGKNVILHCAGRIGRGDETSVLCAAVHHTGREIILDLREVEAIDAAGVGVLIALQASGIYLKLLNPGKAVREVLRVTGIESIFEIFQSRPIQDFGASETQSRIRASDSLEPQPPRNECTPVPASNW